MLRSKQICPNGNQLKGVLLLHLQQGHPFTTDQRTKREEKQVIFYHERPHDGAMSAVPAFLCMSRLADSGPGVRNPASMSQVADAPAPAPVAADRDERTV